MRALAALRQRRPHTMGEALVLGALIFVLLILFGLGRPAHAADQTIFNVSYDPTQELYQEYNAAFVKEGGRSGLCFRSTTVLSVKLIGN